MILAVNSGFGTYIPQVFVERYKDKLTNQGLDEDIETIEKGKDDEFYWDSWFNILDNGKIDGKIIYQSEHSDVWLMDEYPEDDEF